MARSSAAIDGGKLLTLLLWQLGALVSASRKVLDALHAQQTAALLHDACDELGQLRSAPVLLIGISCMGWGVCYLDVLTQRYLGT